MQKSTERLCRFRTSLKNGDFIDVITSSVPHGPKIDWLKICKTSQARNKINQWFKKVNREENIEKGKETIEKELSKNSIPVKYINDESFISPLLKKYGFNGIMDLYARLWDTEAQMLIDL